MARHLAAVLALLAALVGPVAASKAVVTPLQQVINMLSDLRNKGEKELQDEKVSYSEFTQWCGSASKESELAIKQATGQIEQLAADIVKAKADAEGLANDVKQLQGRISAKEKDLKNATEIRAKGLSDFLAAQKDFTESIDAVEKAVEALKARSKTVPAKASLLQVQSTAAVPAEVQAAITSFLELEGGEDSADVFAAAPAATAAGTPDTYKAQAGGVLGLLEKLRLQFQDQLTKLEKEELASKGSHEEFAGRLTNDIKADKDAVAGREQQKAKRLGDAARAQGDLDSTKAGKEKEEKKLAETKTSCSSRAEEFKQNQAIRLEELKALEQAKQILSGDSVSGAAQKNLPKLAQLGASLSLAQLRSSLSRGELELRERVRALLSERAEKTGSRYLSLLASDALADPLVKVREMIKGLITKIMEENTAETTQKGYCDKELATNKQTRDGKSAEVELLTANIEKANADVARLAKELEQLAESSALLRKQQAEATQMRNAEKAKNAQTVKEAKEAQVAVSRAIQVLKDFYGKAAKAALLQSGEGQGEGEGLEVEVSEATRAPYKGMQASSGGVLGLMEVVFKDFARLETETIAGEDLAQMNYAKFVESSKLDLAVKATEVSHKESEKRQIGERALSMKKELALTQDELKAANAYFEQLKPTCIGTPETAAEKEKKRQAEIASLKDALAALDTM